jgi:RNA polymerase sigma factor (sigma-70 family)
MNYWKQDAQGRRGLRDGELVRWILAGDRAAGERLVREHYPRLYRLLRHLTGSVETAQDLTQQTFLKAWQALPAFWAEGRLAPWLNRIAYHEYTHWLRARRPHQPLEVAAALPDPLAARELDAVVARSPLAHLSCEHRETFILFHLQELSVEEVAQVLDIPPGTVKSRLFTARQRLRELFSDPKEDVPHELPASQPNHECS